MTALSFPEPVTHFLSYHFGLSCQLCSKLKINCIQRKLGSALSLFFYLSHSLFGSLGAMKNNPNQAPRRKLIPNLFTNILRVIANSDRPLTQHEIVEAVSERLERSDEELKRQITVNLHDALIYGYLRVKNYRYSIAPSRLDLNDVNLPGTSVSQGNIGNNSAVVPNVQEVITPEESHKQLQTTDSGYTTDER